MPVDIATLLLRSTNFDVWRNGDAAALTLGEVCVRVRSSPPLAHAIRLAEHSDVTFEDFITALMEDAVWFNADNDGPFSFDEVKRWVFEKEHLADAFHVVCRPRVTYKLLFG